MRHILIRLANGGDTEIREDTAEALGIRRGDRVPNDVWQLAMMDQYQRRKREREAKSRGR